MLTELIGALIEGDMDEFLSFYRNVLKTASYYDLQNENSYHLMVLGMTVCLSDQYEILSEKESGKGRTDLILKAREKNFPSFFFEFKYSSENAENLEHLSLSALHQTEEKEYDYSLSGRVCLIGLAHRHKEVSMSYRWIDN